MMLAATSSVWAAYGVCYFQPDILRREFSLPANLEPVNILAVGYPGEGLADPARHSRTRIPLDELVSYETL